MRGNISNPLAILVAVSACSAQPRSGEAGSDTAVPPASVVSAAAPTTQAVDLWAAGDSMPTNCVEQPSRPRAPDGKVDTTIHRDLRSGATFLCRVHPALPEYRFDIVPDSVENLISVVRVRPGKDAPVLQELEGGGPEAPYRDSRYFEVVDLDHDGYGDLMLMSWWGATGNVGHDVWRFDPAAERFVADSELTGIGNIEGPVPGRPCIRQFQTRYFGWVEYCREGGHWVSVRSMLDRPDSTGRRIVRERRERRSGQLQLIRADTIADSAR